MSQHVVIVGTAATQAARLALRNAITAVRIRGGWGDPIQDATGTMFAWGFWCSMCEDDTAFDLGNGTPAGLRKVRRENTPGAVQIIVDSPDWRLAAGWVDPLRP